jgi:hypothetical protein
VAVPANRVHGTQPDAPAARRQSATPATLHASVLNLHRGAGNRAVARLLQRSVGWTDGSKKGRAWNRGEQAVGKIRRIPLEGLTEGLGDSARISTLSSESAKGKAIVLVPDALNAAKPIEVMVFLHGWTEDARTRPYAGWRTLDTKPAGLGDLRRGVDPALVPGAPDIAPVRDVALDQIEQQLQESGQKQLVIVLPQGGLTSEFDRKSRRAFDSKNYISKITTRLHTEGVWKDDKGNAVKDEPTISRVIMAGHSGAGAALSAAAKAGDVTGDLVIYDAINGPGERQGFEEWALRRLEEDLIAIKAAKTDADVLHYLQSAPKLRGYATGYREGGKDKGYIAEYLKLDDAIQSWFDASRTELGKWAGCLRRNYCLEYHDLLHEELMRGSSAAKERAAGTGNVLDAIKALHAPAPASAAACPMPKSLRERYEELQARKKAEREEKAAEEKRRRAEKRKAKAGAR